MRADEQNLQQVICRDCLGTGISAVGSDEDGYTYGTCKTCRKSGTALVPSEEADRHMLEVAKAIMAMLTGQESEDEAAFDTLRRAWVQASSHVRSAFAERLCPDCGGTLSIGYLNEEVKCRSCRGSGCGLDWDDPLPALVTTARPPELKRAVFSCPLCGEEFRHLNESPVHYAREHATPEEREAGHLRVPERLCCELAMPDGTARTIDLRTEDPEELALLKALDEAELERAMGAAIGVPTGGGGAA